MIATQILLPIAIYVFIFFLIEKVSFKKTDKFKSKVIYAVSFSLIVIFANIAIALSEKAPHIAVTIFQIIIVVCLSAFYIVWQSSKK